MLKKLINSAVGINEADAEIIPENLNNVDELERFCLVLKRDKTMKQKAVLKFSICYSNYNLSCKTKTYLFYRSKLQQTNAFYFFEPYFILAANTAVTV